MIATPAVTATTGRRHAAWRRAAMLAVPLLLAGVTALHPTGHREHVFAVLGPQIGRWLAVHWLQLLLLPLAGLVLLAMLSGDRSAAARLARASIYVFAVYYTAFDGIAGLAGLVLAAMLGGERSAAARLARASIYVFVVYYTAFDGIAGLAVGTLIRHGAALPAAQSAIIDDAAQALFRDPWIGGLGALGGIASLAWLVACVATAVVVRRRGGSWAATGALGVSGILLAVTHTPPLGPPAFLALAVAAALQREPGAAGGR